MQTISDLLPKTTPAKTNKDQTPEEQLQQKMRELEWKRLEKEIEAKAALAGLPYVDLSNFAISQEAVANIPEEEARKANAGCFLLTANEARIGTTHPGETVDELAKKLQDKLHANAGVYLVSERSLRKIFRVYEGLPKIRKTTGGVEITEEELKRYDHQFKTFQDLDSAIQKASLSDLVVMILAAALKAEASDIHIEAEENDVKIRLRLDGVLQTAAHLPKEDWKTLISRIKLLAKLKLNVTDEPQDGRFSIFLSNDQIDLRISTLPTAYGESVVMRILKASSTGLDYEKLGLVGQAKKDLDANVTKPNGMIMTTGPTGSGKTTTLYAILNKLNDNETKIITLEDPIEYKLKG
ncbi:MAG: ATPase, T2SS/T4P/T4SS family, partial [bacterium]